MVFNSPCLTYKKELIHHEGTALMVINSHCYHNQELASPEQTATAEVVPKSVAGSSFSAASSKLLPFDVQVTEHLMARSGTDLKIAKLTMSSPNHPTSNVEDAFSLNFLNYLPASPNYFPASLENTYSSSSNSFGVVPIASPTLSLFYDDPYMKVMQAFYAEKSTSIINA
ncbi:hypothetical protein Tco_1441064 [Tanacetum coccineum]